MSYHHNPIEPYDWNNGDGNAPDDADYCPDCEDGKVPDNGTNNGVCETCDGTGFIDRDYEPMEGDVYP